VCKAGTGMCIDRCTDVLCPHNGTCSKGICTPGVDDPGTGATGSGANGPIEFGAGGPPGIPFGRAGSGSGGTPGSSAGAVRPTAAQGCGCRVGGDADAPTARLAWLSALLGLGLVLHRRRATRA